MKKLIFLIVLGTALVHLSPSARADGCYLCSGGGYVKYNGDDTFDKRKQAANIGCQVSGTTSSCSSSKGTVGQNSTESTQSYKVSMTEKKSQ